MFVLSLDLGLPCDLGVVVGVLGDPLAEKAAVSVLLSNLVACRLGQFPAFLFGHLFVLQLLRFRLPPARDAAGLQSALHGRAGDAEFLGHGVL